MPHVMELYFWGQTHSNTEKKSRRNFKKQKVIMEKRHGGGNMSVFSKKQNESEKGPRKTALKGIPQ